MSLSVDILTSRLSDEQTALAGFQSVVAQIQMQLDAANADVKASEARSADLQTAIKILSSAASQTPAQVAITP